MSQNTRNTQGAAESTGHEARETLTALDAAARAAFVALYDHQAQWVQAIAQRAAGGRTGADDIVQETWLTILRLWPGIYREYAPEAWSHYVRRTAQSRAIDFLRRQREAAARTISLSSATLAPTVLDGDDMGRTSRDDLAARLASSTLADDMPEQVAEAREAWRQALALCRTPRERLILTLRGMGFAKPEIAAILAEYDNPALAATPGAVNMVLHRLRHAADGANE